MIKDGGSLKPFKTRKVSSEHPFFDVLGSGSDFSLFSDGYETSRVTPHSEKSPKSGRVCFFSVNGIFEF